MDSESGARSTHLPTTRILSAVPLVAIFAGSYATLTTLLCLEEPKVRELLQIPEGWGTVAYVPIGYPEGKFRRPKRRPSAEFVHYNRFGQRSNRST